MPEVASHAWRLLETNAAQVNWPADQRPLLPAHSVTVWGAN